MKIQTWTLAVILAVGAPLPVASVSAGVPYSPVFNMPLQPAPSPCNGGFYWVAPDGRIYGPNYYVAPPFNPTSGFDGTFAGQRIFAKLHEEYSSGGANKENRGGRGGGGGGYGGGQGGNPQAGQGGGAQGGQAGQGGLPPAKQIGVGGYNLDYSDPDTFKKFDASAPMVNGYVPFGFNQQAPQLPTYGNGPLPMPRYSNYPNFQAAPSPAPSAGYGYGYRPCGWTSQMPQQGVYQAAYYGPAYQPGYYGAGWQNPVVQVQAQAPYCPPGMPYPQGPYNPGYANMPGQPTPYYQGQMPNMPNNYYPTPSPSYGPRSPNLPNPSYEPPPCPCPQYFQNSLVRSPRDFFMWSEVQEDKAAQQRRPMYVP